MRWFSFLRLSEQISDLAAAIRSMPRPATKQDLDQMEKRIMSKISDYAAQVNATFDKIDASVTGLQGDVKNLTDQIAALQNSPGTITPEDQALLDGIQTRASSIADKLNALDAITPPPAPPPTP